MATQVQRRKGTTAQHSTFTGASAELTVDTTKNTVVVHDGVTVGGIPLAKENNATLTGAVTLSGGTANGVTYLNGSKVLTTGSALTFDGTNLGVGTSSPGAKLQVTNGTAGRSSYSSDADDIVIDSTGSGSGMTIASDRASYGVIYFADQDSGTRGIFRYDHVDNSLRLGTDGSERLRITSSGNVGIGTSSPVGKLHVNTGANSFNAVTIAAASATGNTWGLGIGSGADLTFYQNGATAERMRLDSSGNLGIGNTNPTEKLTVTGNAAISGTITEAGSPVVTQSDIGTAPNEIPLNQYLGEMAYMNAEAVVIQPQASVDPNGIGDMVFQLTNNTTLVVKVKGSDGTVRSATLTLA